MFLHQTQLSFQSVVLRSTEIGATLVDWATFRKIHSNTYCDAACSSDSVCFAHHKHNIPICMVCEAHWIAGTGCITIGFTMHLPKGCPINPWRPNLGAPKHYGLEGKWGLMQNQACNTLFLHIYICIVPRCVTQRWLPLSFRLGSQIWSQSLKHRP